ncbi:MAG: hypothetical protein NZ908_00225 [Candidatus Micrarchaeota archaeon]|nr:hypothetical protein [Candidatus Micrarchaeota archaeon]
MTNYVTIGLILLLVGSWMYLITTSQQNQARIDELMNTIQMLRSNISELSEQLADQRQQNQILIELIRDTNESYRRLQSLYNNLSRDYDSLIQDYDNLSRELNRSIEIIRELRSQANRSEWEMFKNLSAWFRENSNFSDTELRSKILRECSNIFSLNIPCATYLMRDKYGYISRVDEFYSLSKFFEIGRGDCKHHALALRALLESLDTNMLLEGMKRVNIIDYEYFSYKIHNNLTVKGYTYHLFSRRKDYEFVVVCFNTQNKGHCGVAISSIKVNSYRDIRWGFVVDPLTGEVLGPLGDKFQICEFPDCFRRPDSVTMVISKDWIDYFDGKRWRRLQ